MNVGGPILVPQSIFLPSPVSALVNRALNFSLQCLHKCERVSFPTMAHHTLKCVKEVCTWKSALSNKCLKDCLNLSKETDYTKLQGFLLGEYALTSEFITKQHCPILSSPFLPYLHEYFQNKIAMFYIF